jgi:RND superfamily putative drug exporter
MFRHLAQFCYRRRWLVVLSWVILLVALGGFSAIAAGDFSSNDSLPGSESQKAFDLLEEHGFDTRAGEEAQIVFEAEQSVLDPAVRGPMEQYFAAIEAQGLNVSVTSPYEEGGQGQISENGRIAYAAVNFLQRSDDEYIQAGDRMLCSGSRSTFRACGSNTAAGCSPQAASRLPNSSA